MPVGLFISIAAKEAMSHGATSSVAKLAFESTTLPLLTVGYSMSAGFLEGVVACLGLMRDAVEGTGAGASSATEPSDSVSDPEDSRRLFLNKTFSMASYDGESLLEEAPEVSLSELEDEWEEADSCRISFGMAICRDVRALQSELVIEGSSCLEEYLDQQILD